MNANQAVLTAIRNSSNWMGGAVVIRDNETGTYDAIPGAYLSDISYTGSRNVVFTVQNAHDVLGDDPAGYTDDDLLAYIDENIVPGLE